MIKINSSKIALQNKIYLGSKQYLIIYSLIVIPPLLDFFAYNTNAARLSRILIAILMCQNLLIQKKQIYKRKKFNFELFLLTYLIIQGIIIDAIKSAPFSPNFIIIIIFAFYINSEKIITNKEKLIDILILSSRHLILVSFITIIFSLNLRNEYSASRGYFIPFQSILGIAGRQYGIFYAPNALAQVSGFVFLSCLMLRSSVFYSTISFFCLLESGSRSSLIITIILSIVILVRKKESAKTIKATKVKDEYLSFLKTQIYYFLIVITLSIFLTIVDSLNNSNFNQRVFIWKTSLAYLQNDLFLGMGWRWYENAIDIGMLPTWATNAHNVNFEILFSTGIIGLFIFIVIITRIFNSNVSHIRRIILIYLLTSGLTESNLQFIYADFFTYVLLILAVGEYQNERLIVDEN